MGKTKKVGSSGKFGTRYGMRLRKRWLEVDKKQKALYECPTCKRLSVKRQSSGIWICKKCNTKFIGGAYQPFTDAAKKIEQGIREDENV
jgi:large subunit ribosomal protein L37Ae